MLPERRKGMPGESKMKGKETISQQSKKKKHKPSASLSTTSSSSIKEINMLEKSKEFEQCSNMEILSKNIQEL